MKLQYDDRAKVCDPCEKRYGETGRVIEVTEWTATLAFGDRFTKLYGLTALTKVESPAPVVG